MPRWANKSYKKQRLDNANWFLALILILLTGLVVWAIINLRVDIFTDVLKKEEPISILFVIDDGEFPLATEVFFYHPLTKKGALLAIPEKTGTLLSAIDEVARLEKIYHPENREKYRKAIASLIGQKIDFSLRIGSRNFEKAVDYLGGLDIFIPHAIDDYFDTVRYLFPPGGVNLDGAKSRAYLEYRPINEGNSARIEREHRVLRAFLKALGNEASFVLSKDIYPYFSILFDTDLDHQSLTSFIRELASFDAERLVLQGILGNNRFLDGQEILFPYYEGNLLRETVGRLKETLARSDTFGDENLKARIQILNGTEINGLASRSSEIYRSYGFHIVSIMNADRHDYERSIVIDHRGNLDAAHRVAELIRCEQIYTQIEEDRDQTVDVTVILGKDFDGRYVIK